MSSDYYNIENYTTGATYATATLGIPDIQISPPPIQWTWKSAECRVCKNPFGLKALDDICTDCIQEIVGRLLAAVTLDQPLSEKWIQHARSLIKISVKDRLENLRA